MSMRFSDLLHSGNHKVLEEKESLLEIGALWAVEVCVKVVSRQRKLW